MTLCIKCNTENHLEARFCETCGNTLAIPSKQHDTVSDLNFCPDCGINIEPDTSFCANCGNAFGEQCTHCQTANQADAKFCAGCANPLNWVCPVCNNKNQVGAIFCAACGKDHHVSIRKRLLKPQYIAAASLILLFAVFGITGYFGKNNSSDNQINRSSNTYTNQSQSKRSSNSSSQSKLKKYAFLSFNLSNEFDNDAKLTLKCPDGVYFDPSGSSMGSVSSSGSYAKDISGRYEFTYSNTDYVDDGFMGLSSKKVRRSYSGSFYLDGKFESYDIEISSWSNTVTVYGR